jgi:hypothetical protein
VADLKFQTDNVVRIPDEGKKVRNQGCGRLKIQTDNVVRILVESFTSSSYSIIMFLRLYCKNLMILNCISGAGIIDGCEN